MPWQATVSISVVLLVILIISWIWFSFKKSSFKKEDIQEINLSEKHKEETFDAANIFYNKLFDIFDEISKDKQILSNKINKKKLNDLIKSKESVLINRNRRIANERDKLFEIINQEKRPTNLLKNEKLLNEITFLKKIYSSKYTPVLKNDKRRNFKEVILDGFRTKEKKDN